MHIPGTDGKILSLKILVQKGFESHILADCIHISKDGKTYAEASLGRELYEIKMNIITSQESIMVAVKRDSPTMDLFTWHWRLGQLGDSMLKKLVNSNMVKGMEVMNTHLASICEDCVIGKMDEKPVMICSQC